MCDKCSARHSPSQSLTSCFKCLQKQLKCAKASKIQCQFRPQRNRKKKHIVGLAPKPAPTGNLSEKLASILAEVKGDDSGSDEDSDVSTRSSSGVCVCWCWVKQAEVGC